MAKKKPRTPTPPRPVQAPTHRPGAPRQRPAIDVDRRTLAWGAAVVAALALAIGLSVALSGSSSAGNPAPTIAWSSLPGLQTGPPPWGPDLQTLAGRVPLLGLHQLSAEGSVLHIHQHLDLWVNGTKVEVPANLGIDDNTFITEVHVHPGEADVIHVESPVQQNFYLGQVFGEWGVRLTSSCVGRYCGALHWWVNGVEQHGNPADLKLASHQEIAIALGKAPAQVPSTYPFAAHGL